MRKYLICLIIINLLLIIFMSSLLYYYFSKPSPSMKPTSTLPSMTPSSTTPTIYPSTQPDTPPPTPTTPTPILSFYAQGEIGGPKNLQKYIQKIIDVGINDIIFSLCHIGRHEIVGFDSPDGQKSCDLIFNETIFISDGKIALPEEDYKCWKDSMSKLQDKQKSMHFSWSFGGSPGVYDCDVLSFLFQNQNKDLLDILLTNLTALREAFPLVTCIDIDCEEDVSKSTITEFINLCSKAGFNEFSVCPVTINNGWIFDKVYRVNYQAYHGVDEDGIEELKNIAPIIVIGCLLSSNYTKEDSSITNKINGIFMWGLYKDADFDSFVKLKKSYGYN